MLYYRMCVDVRANCDPTRQYQCKRELTTNARNNVLDALYTERKRLVGINVCMCVYYLLYVDGQFPSV